MIHLLKKYQGRVDRYGARKRIYSVRSDAVAQAREPFAWACPTGAKRGRLGLHHLPSKNHGLYGGHERGEDKHDGRSCPVRPGLDGDDGGHDDPGHASPDPALPHRHPPAVESDPSKGWHNGSAYRLHRGWGCCRTTYLCLCPNGPNHGPIRSRVTRCALGYRGCIPVHFAQTQLPRALQQPPVLPHAQVEAGHSWSVAARSAARHRLPGLLRRPDDRVGGAGHDEPRPGLYGCAHHLRRKDATRKPPHRAPLRRFDGGGWGGVPRVLSAWWNGKWHGSCYRGRRDACCGGQYREHGGIRDGIHVAIKLRKEVIYRTSSISHPSVDSKEGEKRDDRTHDRNT